MRSSSIIWMSLTTVTCPHKRHTEGPVKMEAGNGGMWPQAQEAGSQEKLREAGTVSPGTSRGSLAPWLWAPALQKRKRTHFSCFTPPSLVARYGRKLTQAGTFHLSPSVPQRPSGWTTSTTSTGHLPSGSSWIQRWDRGWENEMRTGFSGSSSYDGPCRWPDPPHPKQPWPVSRARGEKYTAAASPAPAPGVCTHVSL